jgi:hypothetical protein
MTQNLPLIACSLDGTGQAARLVEWAELLRLAIAREEIPGGVRYAFANSDGGVQARVRALAEAEQDCCSFLRFGVTATCDRVEMTVVAPADAQEALRFVFSA